MTMMTVEDKVRWAEKLRPVVEGIEAILGRPMPRKALAFDVETSGLDFDYDRILQYGWISQSEAREPTCPRISTVQHPPGVLSRKIEEITTLSQSKLDKGHSPARCLVNIFGVLQRAEAADFAIIGHNAAAFDRRFIEREADLNGMAARGLFDNLIDTGCIVKAAQFGQAGIPKASDDLQGWNQWIANERARGVYWSLDRFCAKEFGLMHDEPAWHNAGFDAMQTLRLYHTLIDLAAA